MSLELALAVVCCIRHQRKTWADRTDPADHPLMSPDPIPTPGLHHDGTDAADLQAA